MRFPLAHLVLLALMLTAAAAGTALRPTISLADERQAIDLTVMVPTAFDDWREQRMSSAHIIDPTTQEKLDEFYSQTLTRTYVNGNGYQIMLSVAYGKNQSDALQLHKPEICYPAQGFAVLHKQNGSIELGTTIVPATRLKTKLNLRNEPVTYWTVIGDHVTKSVLDKKFTEMRYAMRNRIPDGMLIRVSSIDGDATNAFEVHNRFASQMVQAISPTYRERFAGIASAPPASRRTQ